MTPTGLEPHRPSAAATYTIAALAATLMLLAAAPNAPGAVAFMDKKILISVRSQPRPTGTGQSKTSHGCIEYRVIITNKDPKKKSHTVRLELPSKFVGPGNDNCIESVTQTVTVAPGPPRIVSMVIPGLYLPGRGLHVIIDGHVSGTVACDQAYHGQVARHGAALLSKNTSTDVANQISGVRTSAGEPSTFISQESVAAWSTNWLAYTRYDLVAVRSDELRGVHPGILDALGRYVECGGSLVVIGPWEMPANWTLIGGKFRGQGEYQVGFGRCLIVEDIYRGNLYPLQTMMEGSFAPWQREFDVLSANKQFSVMDDLQIPVHGLFVLMILFAILIGPVNLVVLALKRKRIWMLWTVPAVSLVTCAAVFIYATWVEGWSGHRRTEAITILNQVHKRATTIGWTGYYSPMTPSEGLHFSHDTEVTPMVRTEYDSYGYGYGYGSGYSGSYSDEEVQGTRRSVSLGGTQHLDSGWIRARVPAHFMLRKSDSGPAAERRLDVKDVNGNVTIVNGLGVEIRELYVADRRGDIHTGRDISAGAEVSLRATAGTARGTTDRLRALYTTTWVENVSESDLWRSPAPNRSGIVSGPRAGPGNYLVPGTYLALTEDSPFLEEGLEDANIFRSRAAIYGIYALPR